MTTAARCSACSGLLRETDRVSLSACQRCDGLHGLMYLGDATAAVGIGLPMLANASSDDALRYFDLEIISSAGVERIHGWYDATQHRVVQYG